MTVRRRTQLLFLILLLAGGAAVSFAGTGLFALGRAFGARAPLVAFDDIDAVGLLAGVSLLSFAAVCLLPAPDLAPGQRRRMRQPGRGLELGPVLMLFGGACLIATPVAPSLVHALVDAAAHDRGYVTCPRIHWPRRQPDRWALASGAGAQATCPKEQAHTPS